MVWVPVPQKMEKVFKIVIIQVPVLVLVLEITPNSSLVLGNQLQNWQSTACEAPSQPSVPNFFYLFPKTKYFQYFQFWFQNWVQFQAKFQFWFWNWAWFFTPFQFWLQNWVWFQTWFQFWFQNWVRFQTQFQFWFQNKIQKSNLILIWFSLTKTTELSQENKIEKKAEIFTPRSKNQAINLKNFTLHITISQ